MNSMADTFHINVGLQNPKDLQMAMRAMEGMSQRQFGLKPKIAIIKLRPQFQKSMFGWFHNYSLPKSTTWPHLT